MFEDLTEDIKEINVVEKIQNASNEIYSTWNDVKFDETGRIRDVWVDKASRIYIDKLLETDQIVQEALRKIEELQECWQKYLRKLENDREEMRGGYR